MEKTTTGHVISELARRADGAAAPTASEPKAIYGFRPFPKRKGRIVSNELINKLREDGEY